jgi:hypothetical protein
MAPVIFTEARLCANDMISLFLLLNLVVLFHNLSFDWVCISKALSFRMFCFHFLNKEYLQYHKPSDSLSLTNNTYLGS